MADTSPRGFASASSPVVVSPVVVIDNDNPPLVRSAYAVVDARSAVTVVTHTGLSESST